MVLFSLQRDAEGVLRDPSGRVLFPVAADRLRLYSVDRGLDGREFAASGFVDREVLGCEFAECALAPLEVRF